MTQQLLDGQQVGAGFQQVGGVTVPQRVRCDVARETAAAHEALKVALGGTDVQAAAAVAPGEQEVVGPTRAGHGGPIRTQRLRQGHEAILAALALTHQHHVAGEVEIAAAQVRNLGDAQPRGISQSEQQAIRPGRHGVEQALHLGATEHGRQRLGPALVR